LVYQVLRLGRQVDLRSEVSDILTNGLVYWGIIPEEKAVSPLSLSGIHGCMLLRLGESELARRAWEKHAEVLQARRAPREQSASGLGTSRLPEADPYLDWATEWTWCQFDRATFAHVRGDDGLALAALRDLAEARSRVEAEAERRGFKHPPSYNYNGTLLTTPE